MATVDRAKRVLTAKGGKALCRRRRHTLERGRVRRSELEANGGRSGMIMFPPRIRKFHVVVDVVVAALKALKTSRQLYKDKGITEGSSIQP